MIRSHCKFKSILILILLCIPCLYTTTLAAGSNFFEPPLIAQTKEVPIGGWLLSSNDGFGHNYGTDEDNLRTYGINIGAWFLNRFLTTAEWQSFTDRNTTPEKSKRIDEIKILAGYKLFEHRSAPVHLSLYSGAGLLAYGDFGTLKIQEGAHQRGSEIPRTLPQTYDNVTTQDGLGFIYADAFLSAPIALDASVYAHLTGTLDHNINLSLAGWMVKPMIQSSINVTYRYNSVTHSGSTARTVYDRETGFWLANKTYIGPLVIERGANINTLAQYSYVGFRVCDHTRDTTTTAGYRLSYSLGAPIGHNSWVEIFRVHPLESTPRIAFFFRNYHTENKFENNSTMLPDDRHVRRIKETSLGTELYFSDQKKYTPIDAFIFAGAGVCREMVTTYDQFEARFLEDVTAPMVHGGCGIRAMIPDLIFKKAGRYVGVELLVNVRYDAYSSNIYSNPDMLLSWGFVFSE